MQPLETPDALAAALSAPRAAILKHSPRCAISRRALDEFAAVAGDAALAGVPLFVLDVLADRALSTALAEATGVRHASPQLLVLDRGAVAWHGSHGALDRETMRRHLRSEMAPRRAT